MFATINNRNNICKDSNIVLLNILYGITILIGLLKGVSLDETPREFYIQFINKSFVENNFVQSLLFLHHQAPLLNLLAWSPILLLGDYYGGMILNIIYAIVPLLTINMMYLTMKAMGSKSWVALWVCVGYILWPSRILFDNLLFYHSITALLIVTILYGLVGYYGTQITNPISKKWAIYIVGGLTLLVLTRATIGWIFIISVICLLMILRGFKGRRLSWGLLIPLLIAIGLSIKPLVLTSVGYGEVLFWGNLPQKLYAQLSEQEKFDFHKLFPNVKSTKHFIMEDIRNLKEMRMPLKKTGVAMLDDPLIQEATPNAHALEYVLIAREYYKEDFLKLVKMYPHRYIESVATGLYGAMSPVTNDMMVDLSNNYDKLKFYIDLAERYILLVNSEGKSYTLLLSLPILFIYGLYFTIRNKSLPSLSIPSGFAVLCIGYIVLSTSAISFGDFARYRYDVDPLFMIIMSLLITSITDNIRANYTARKIIRDKEF